MGKPFDQELRALQNTLEFAKTSDITSLCEFVAKCKDELMYAVGVGGSYTAATCAAALQQARGGHGIARTTLGFIEEAVDLRDAHVLLLTGSGKNHDILLAFEHAVASEAKSTLVLCGSKGSRIAAKARKFWDTGLLEFTLRAGADGFLATNSLVATCTVLARAYGASTEEIATPARGLVSEISSWADRIVKEGRDTLLVLHSGRSSTAATDVESKCSEAALRNILLSDFRHFAHGRHQWLAKRASTSAVLACITEHDADIAAKTLALLPRTIPVLRLQSRHSGVAADIDLLMQVFHLVASLGRAQSIDPGRPGVPPFGRNIYNLRMRRASLLVPTRTNLQQIAITRKRRMAATAVDLSAAYETFLLRLSKAHFTAVVFDFDGTLCSAKDRLFGITPLLHPFLIDIATNGILVGIATGRGKSAHSALRQVFPAKLWPMILVGYYNGACLAPLTEEPPNIEVARSILKQLSDYLYTRGLAAVCEMDLRRDQLTVRPLRREDAKTVAIVLNEALMSHGSGARLVYSSHSFDVLAPGVTKLRVVEACSGRGGDVLCVGDRGAWPGNDFQLLATPFSLSVDSVSANPETCWNLSPAGVRFVQGTCFYLAGLKASLGSVSYSLPRSVRWFRTAINE